MPHDAGARLSYLLSRGGPDFPLGRRFQLPPKQRRPSSVYLLVMRACRTLGFKQSVFAYYPAFQPHALVNASDRPVLYTMLKWRNKRGHAPNEAAGLTFVRAADTLAAVADPGNRNRGTILNTRTRWLDRLHCHVSIAVPGVGYAPHADRYDVAIVLFSGAIETLGKTVSAPALLYHPARAMHGLKSVGTEPARYLVFELDKAVSRWSALIRAGRNLLGR